jgi:hypothetical protein
MKCVYCAVRTGYNCSSEFKCLGSFVRTSSRSVLRSTFRWSFPYSPPAVGFGILRWSVVACSHRVVQLSCLFEPQFNGPKFLLPHFSFVCPVCRLPVCSASFEVSPQGNLRGRSLKVSRLTATADWGIHLRFRVFFLCQLYLIIRNVFHNLKYDYYCFNISNNQTEIINVDISDHGTWSKFIELFVNSTYNCTNYCRHICLNVARICVRATTTVLTECG